MADDQTIRIYYSSVSSSLKIKKEQMKIENVLESKKYKTEYIDIATDADAKKEMREKCCNPSAVPPQLFRGDTHLGDFEAFDNALESEALDEFLGVCS